MNKDEIKSRIRIEPWSQIRSQLTNEKLFNINYQIDFIQVAMAIAKDDDQLLLQYMNKGALRKPQSIQIEKWDKTPEKNFQMVIIDGYILFQEVVSKRKY